MPPGISKFVVAFKLLGDNRWVLCLIVRLIKATERKGTIFPLPGKPLQ